MTMRFSFHQYKYYPYELSLASRELQSVLSPRAINLEHGALIADRPRHIEAATRLVYFSEFSSRNAQPTPTQQCLLERVNGSKRQSTRYSAHGLHEYKGKFNPQVAKAMLNIFGAKKGQSALDPFCGSGTSLVECAHLGIRAIGIDMNPLAVFLANAKLGSLGVPADKLLKSANSILSLARKSRGKPIADSERVQYLQLWFPPDNLTAIESLKRAVDAIPSDTAPILLAIASNLLRDYSLQDPADLRIRRRTSPLPEISFFDAFEAAVVNFCNHLRDAQSILGALDSRSQAVLTDCRAIDPKHKSVFKTKFDLALTSPPYATALPYIDTQRLSLVWLDLLPPSEILSLEARLVGSREIRGQRKKTLLVALESNDAGLPEQEVSTCISLQDALGENDGFRRIAVPRLLYRYFAGMAHAFTSVRGLVRGNAPFGLIVGGNHTVLGGKRFDIDTPSHLVSIAQSRGWKHEETIPLQTYQRYGTHVNNATNSEALVILRA